MWDFHINPDYVSQCRDNKKDNEIVKSELKKSNFGGFNSQIEWGEHLVVITWSCFGQCIVAVRPPGTNASSRY